MTAGYEIWFTDDSGARLAQLSGKALLDDALSFSATKTVNDIGALALYLPWSFDRNLLRSDNMVQIWRAPAGGRLSMFQAYFVNRWETAIARGVKTIALWGAGPNSLLSRRHVVYFNNEASSMIDAVEADDAMKDIVSSNLVTATAFEAGADTTARQWSTVTVQGDLTAGPALTGQYAWQNVLDVLQAMSADSESKGTHVWFEMVPILGSNSISFQFRTYTGQPGNDLTNLGVVFSADKGTLSSVSLEYDYTDEATYIYSLGQGEDSDRNVQTASDAIRIGESLYGRKEAVVNATISEDDAGVQSSADSGLFDGRPRIRFSATPMDTEQFRFGRDWNFGDKVRSRFENREFDSIVKTVMLSVRNQEETISTRLEYES